MTGWQPTTGIRFDGQEGRWIVLEWRSGADGPEYREREVQPSERRLQEVNG